MAKLIASLFLLSLPLTISAEPIFVDYDGEVSGLFPEEGGPPITDFHVGQRIEGRLTISTELAGPDTAFGPGFGNYFNQGTDFVAGELTSLAGSSPWDSVHVQPYAPKPDRYYGITDRSVVDSNNETRFQIIVDRIPNEIVDDDIWQAFTAEPEKDGSRIWSILLRVKDGAQSTVQFLFDKVSVTPRSCLAP